jgi:CheY-like chemotaxis protein
MPADERRSVLIVDDDRDTREMYCESLRADGFDASTAQSGEAALRLTASAMPAVVVTDLRLRGTIDGIELTRRLRAASAAQSLGIIVLTGATLGDERERAEAAGCDRFLAKPCLPEALAGEIRGLTHSRASSRSSKGDPPAGRLPKAAGTPRRKSLN